MITPDAPVLPTEFAGREKAINKVRDQLLSREVLSAALVAGPRTGKTSLLRYLASPFADPIFPGLRAIACILTRSF